MKRILLIARREWQAIVGSPSGLIVIALYLVVSGYMFSMTISMTHEATLRYTFTSLGFLTIFVVPLITMRLLAEELRSGTFEILVSHPVTDIEIILGKFLAGWMAFAALSAPTLSYLLILQVFGAPDWGPALCGYLGQQLLAAMLIAMGLMISAMTASQVLAAMCAIVGGILFLLAGTAANSIEGWLGRALTYLAMMDHFALFQRGVIDTRALVFFMATTLMFLYLAVRAVESRRWKFGTVPAGYFVRWKRPALSIVLAALALIFSGEAVIARTIHGMWTAYNNVFITMGVACGIMPLWLNRIRLGHLLSRNQIGLVLTVIINSLCVIGIWALVTFMTSQHYLRLDLTSSRQYALSEQTLNVIKQLAAPIEIVVVMNSPADLKNNIVDLLAEYKARSPRISIKDLDAVRHPGELEQLRQRFNLTSTLENEVVVITGDRMRRIPLGSLVNQKFRNVNGQLQPAAPPHFTGEAEITSAIIQLTGKSGGQVVFLAGHAERNLEESGNDGIAFAVKQLARNGWHVEKQVIAPGANASFPTNTAVVVVAGPHQK